MVSTLVKSEVGSTLNLQPELEFDLARKLITASCSFECHGSYEYLRSVFGKMIDSNPQRRRPNLTL